ncbi:TlpA family protein disulfide reductase [Phycisphaera mikurensis]|uniref:Putative oxidoreductase n=1 Tax=Phycisphaera mikurensis (strain NBRC 102666 / KCTC 22515 / FYK2301M01) TaxID=1142394 RepID=I0IIJ8_PHYMF|nr:TlpA disulfide reductase family protein [Phycisphaera mikurensis]MBB6442757.1 thiol-disulfide isomerase/thioredoxin [Phycisphaera mikurensis]BAM05086.1 putative oxidoreductase [Phycisphaera mikurensis NBRC 102666]
MRLAPSTLALLAAALLAGPAAAQEAPAAEAPAADAPATGAAPLPERLQAAGAELRQVLASPDAVLDPEQREANRDRVVPAILKMRGLLSEGIEAGMVPPAATGEFDMMLALYEHEETVERLEAEAEAEGPAADGAFGSLVAADALAATDDAGRDAAVGRFADRAAERPDSEALVGVGGMLMSLPGMGEAQRERVMAVLDETLTSEGAARVVAGMKAESEAEGKLDALVGQPLVLAGTTADGGTVSTADWKGKVVLVDFWATWCGPCIAELPKVKKAYADYKDQGLEVLGVSCDASAEDVTSFVADQDGMPWPNLFEEGQDGWHPLATELGVRAIPTMFLIDRAGIVRSVTAREDYKELIPVLLAEEAPSM